MTRVIKTMPLVVLCALIIAVPSVWAGWVLDGVALCTEPGNQNYSAIVSDGANGAIVTWQDYRSGNWDIYAQRVNALGDVQWMPGGVPLCTATGTQDLPQTTSDGAGGAIVTWLDGRSGSSYDIYAQRVDANGGIHPGWPLSGVALCPATLDPEYLTITSDGAGGAIVTWSDRRNGSWDIYAQRVDADGGIPNWWPLNGVALCMAAGDQFIPSITSDGAGGAIVAWYDGRSGIDTDIYAQRVDAGGGIHPGWLPNGVPLCVWPGTQNNAHRQMIVSDGANGAIVTWQDDRNGNWDIYAQRVDAGGGIPLGWPPLSGVALCGAPGAQAYPTITSDCASGAIVTWEDHRSGNWDIYAQRVEANGDLDPGWLPTGRPLCTAAGNQNVPTITSDYHGGAIVTWEDQRSGNSDIYVQRVNASGTVQWTTDGVAFCTATRYQQYPTITANGKGTAIVTWWDGRSGIGTDIYAQSIDVHGHVGVLAPNPDILVVGDVAMDQGGCVRITIESSSLDDAGELAYPISTYNIWQRIDDPALLALIAQGSGGGAASARMSEGPLKCPVDASSVSSWPVKELNGRYFVQSKELLKAGAFPPGTWELLGSFAACQQDEYIYRASTLADSTASGIPYSVYIVSAHTTTPSVWFASDPDSGYSVDNLPPEQPKDLVAEQSYTPVGLALLWNVNAANDLSHYAVYRGLTEDFVPGVGNRLATPMEPEWFDGSWRWNSGYYYKVSAIDVHDNQSGFALLTPDDVTGADTPKAPEASYLSQNYPNPFNPMTRIAFGLSAPGHVSLRIYDATGRLVRALVNEERRAARYEETWDGGDSNGRGVASGIYFYRLNAGAFESTKKMILVR